MNELTNKVEQWAMARDLHTANPDKQFRKVVEEVGEVAEAMNKQTNELPIELGDVFVTITVLAMQNGLNIEDCIRQAYDKIAYRKGRLVNGIYVKESDLK